MTSKVYITGAGTGRFELLTVRAKDVIQKADIIFYDRLVNPNLLFLARPDCELVSVGKSPYHPSISQEEIVAQLIEASKQYKHIVRLKSGDPYIFGRGGEEASELEQAQIEWEYIPGVSSSAAGLSFGGIPLTYRDIALDFHVFTAHAKDGTAVYDWQAISRLQGTLVFMMGVKLLAHIVQSLMDAGKAGSTPVAMIEWASRGQQRTITGTLNTIVQLAQQAAIQAPAVIVIGPVVSFRTVLNFFEQKPLFAKKIAIPASTMQVLLPQLESLGAEVVLFESPQKCSIPLQLDPATLPNTIVLGDVGALKRWNEWLVQQQLDWRKLTDLHIVTLQDHTRNFLQRQGILADQHFESVAQLLETYTAADLANLLVLAGQDTLTSEEKVTIPNVIETGYERYSGRWNTEALLASDCFIFPNKKAVRSLQQYQTDQSLWSLLRSKPALCLGPNAASLLEELDFKRIIITKQPTYQSLVTLLKSEVF